MHAFGTTTGLSPSHQWIRFGFAVRKDGASPAFGQADISAMFQVKPCGKVVGNINASGIEVEATRDIPISDWFDVSPAPTSTPAWARIMARVSSTGGAATIGQIVANGQMM